MSKKKKPKRCACSADLLLDGTCRYGCHLHRKPAQRVICLQTKIAQREAASNTGYLGRVEALNGVRSAGMDVWETPWQKKRTRGNYGK